MSPRFTVALSGDRPGYDSADEGDSADVIRDEVDARRTRATLRTNMSWLGSERVINLLVTMGLGVAILRYLGPSQFGIYSFAAATVALFAPVSQLAAPLVVRELVAAGRAGSGAILGSVTALTGIISLACVAILVGGVRHLAPNRESAAVLTVLSLALLINPVMCIDFYFQANLLARYASVSRVIGQVAMSLGILVVIAGGFGTVPLAIASLLGTATTALCYALFARNTSITTSTLRIDRKTLRRIAGRNLPLTVSAAAIVVYMRIDQVMLGWLSENSEVGMYAASVRLTEATYLLPTIFIASMAPVIADLKMTDEQRYRRVLQRVFSLLGAGSVVVVTLLLLTSSFVPRLIFGSSYGGVAEIVRGDLA